MNSLIMDRIQEIIKLEGGKQMKTTLKWKNVFFNKIHISDLKEDDFSDGWLPDSEVLAFFEVVLRQYYKSF